MVISQEEILNPYFDIPAGQLKWSTYYYWRVNARNTYDVASAWSAYAFFRTAAGPAPCAPGGLTVEATSSSRLDLSWQDTSNNEIGFKIERKTEPGGTYSTIVTLGDNVSSYNNANLTAGTVYSYRIRAYNFNGASDL